MGVDIQTSDRSMIYAYYTNGYKPGGLVLRQQPDSGAYLSTARNWTPSRANYIARADQITQALVQQAYAALSDQNANAICPRRPRE